MNLNIVAQWAAVYLIWGFVGMLFFCEAIFYRLREICHTSVSYCKANQVVLLFRNWDVLSVVHSYVDFGLLLFGLVLFF